MYQFNRCASLRESASDVIINSSRLHKMLPPHADSRLGIDFAAGLPVFALIRCGKFSNIREKSNPETAKPASGGPYSPV
jgi:hypothetical protein